jgi:hypothetical protein
MANRNAVSEILKSTDFARHICCQAAASQGSNTKLLLDQLVLVVMDRTSTITRSPTILRFHSSWRKEIFPAKETLSLHDAALEKVRTNFVLDQFE